MFSLLIYMAQAGPKNESRHKIVAEASYFGEGGGGQHRKLMRENAHNSLRDISLRMLEENMSQRARLQKQIKFDDPKPFKATPQDQVNTSVHICIITQGGGVKPMSSMRIFSESCFGIIS